MKINFDQLQNQLLQNTFDSTIASSSIINTQSQYIYTNKQDRYQRSYHNSNTNIASNVSYTKRHKQNQNHHDKLLSSSSIINSNNNKTITTNPNSKNTNTKQYNQPTKNTQKSKISQQKNPYRNNDKNFDKNHPVQLQNKNHLTISSNKYFNANLRSYSEIQKNLNKRLKEVEEKQGKKEGIQDFLQIAEDGIGGQQSIKGKRNNNERRSNNNPSNVINNTYQPNNYFKKQQISQRYSTNNTNNRQQPFILKLLKTEPINVQNYIKSIQQTLHHSIKDNKQHKIKNNEESFHLRLSGIKNAGCRRKQCKEMVPTIQKHQIMQIHELQRYNQGKKKGNNTDKNVKNKRKNKNTKNKYSQLQQNRHNLSLDLDSNYQQFNSLPLELSSQLIGNRNYNSISTTFNNKLPTTTIHQRLYSQSKKKQFSRKFNEQLRNAKQFQQNFNKQKFMTQKSISNDKYTKNYVKFYDRLDDLNEWNVKKYQFYEKLNKYGSLNRMVRGEGNEKKKNNKKSIDTQFKRKKTVAISQSENTEHNNQSPNFIKLSQSLVRPTQSFLAKTSQQYNSHLFLSSLQQTQLSQSLQKKLGINPLSQSIISSRQTQLLKRIKTIFYNKNKQKFMINTKKIQNLNEKQFTILFDMIRNIQGLIEKRRFKSQKQLERYIQNAYENMPVVEKQQLRRIQILGSYRKNANKKSQKNTEGILYSTQRHYKSVNPNYQSENYQNLFTSTAHPHQNKNQSSQQQQFKSKLISQTQNLLSSKNKNKPSNHSSIHQQQNHGDYCSKLASFV